MSHANLARQSEPGKVSHIKSSMLVTKLLLGAVKYNIISRGGVNLKHYNWLQLIEGKWVAVVGSSVGHRLPFKCDKSLTKYMLYSFS